MAFTLTSDYVDAVLATLRTGNFPAFLDFVEAEVDWRQGASEGPGERGTGVCAS